MKDDATLLRCYARDRSEGDFAELVRRHVNFVYSAALRQVNGDAHLAQDVTQQVFADVARKAATLANHHVLTGWLFISTRFAAAKLVRSEQRRRLREQEAQSMQEISHPDANAALDWEHIRPVLDDALAELNERDRHAILLRFFAGRDFAEVGHQLALSDNAARMRTERALDKLRALLARRGVTSSAAALALMLGNQAVIAAPAGLAASVTGTALTGLVATSAAAATLTFMSITKLQLGLTSAILVAGAGGYLVQEKNITALHHELALIQQPGAQELAQLQEKNLRLAQAVSEADALQVNETELMRLRDDANALQARLQANARQVAAAARTSSPASTQQQALDISKLDSRPVLKSRVHPTYPYEMAKAGISGSVMLEIVINSQGSVAQAKVVQSSHAGFEMAAVTAAMQWQFNPGSKGGRPVNTRVRQELEFDLGDFRPTPLPLPVPAGKEGFVVLEPVAISSADWF